MANNKGTLASQPVGDINAGTLLDNPFPNAGTLQSDQTGNNRGTLIDNPVPNAGTLDQND